MKRLIAVSLLLLSPALAGADQTFNITSGSIFVEGGGGMFNFAGNGFSAHAYLAFVGGPCSLEGNPLLCGFGPGPQSLHFGTFYSQDGGIYVDNLTINGVPWFVAGDIGGYAQAGFGHTVNITGVGTYSGDFNSFVLKTYGVPITDGSPQNCDQCVLLDFLGQGTWTLEVVPSVPGTCGGPECPPFQGSQETYTFRASEPSTASLLLIALAGMGLTLRRRRSGERGLAPQPQTICRFG